MAYAFFYDVPGDERIYRQVNAEIGSEPAKGLVVQVVTKRPEGGLRHFTVWESPEDWNRFQEDRVTPAVATVLAGMGITDPPPKPAVQEMELVDVITNT